MSADVGDRCVCFREALAFVGIIVAIQCEFAKFASKSVCLCGLDES